jgi:predicted transcriptional regulator of viral defense system
MAMPKKAGETHDTSLMARLYALAAPQCGMVTAGQAVKAGIARSSLEYHARPDGQLERCGRGLYRLRRFPPSEHSHLWRAHLPVARAGAVISHISALWLFGLYAHAPMMFI